jgi:hypothetical protein
MDKHGFRDDVRYGWERSPTEKIEFLRNSFELNATDTPYTLGVVKSQAKVMGINEPDPETDSTLLKLMLQKDESGDYLIGDPYQVIRNVNRNRPV